MHTHNIGLHSNTAEDRPTTDFRPKDWLHLSSHLPVVQPSRRPGRGGFQREHWRFERFLRPQPLEHYPGGVPGKHVQAHGWLASGGLSREMQGFGRHSQEAPGLRRRFTARRDDPSGLWWKRGLMDAPSLGSDSLLPTKCMRLFKAVREQLIQEGRFG